MKRDINAYRAIREADLPFYVSGDVDQLEGLEGHNYIKNPEERVNDIDYDPNLKYLHFFVAGPHDEGYRSAKEFAEAKQKAHPEEKMIVVGFHLPDELLKDEHFGRYYDPLKFGFVLRKEVAFETAKYKKEFFVESFDLDSGKKVYYDPDDYGFFQ